MCQSLECQSLECQSLGDDCMPKMRLTRLLYHENPMSWMTLKRSWITMFIIEWDRHCGFVAIKILFPKMKKSKTSGWRVSGLINSRNMHFEFSWFHLFSPVCKAWLSREFKVNDFGYSWSLKMSTKVSIFLTLRFIPKAHVTSSLHLHRSNWATLTDLAEWTRELPRSRKSRV